MEFAQAWINLIPNLPVPSAADTVALEQIAVIATYMVSFALGFIGGNQR